MAAPGHSVMACSGKLLFFLRERRIEATQDTKRQSEVKNQPLSCLKDATVILRQGAKGCSRGNFDGQQAVTQPIDF
jgi:hypothetical protein